MTNAEKVQFSAVEQPIPEQQNPPIDPFAPENLRLPQNFTEQIAVKKLLTTVPVRKPGKQDWVRVHPAASFRENFPILELKDEREEYVVHTSLLDELSHEVVSKTLFTAITRQGTLFLWPIRLPDSTGKDNDYWRSGREAAQRAMSTWIRLKANQNLKAYDIFEAAAKLSEPEWPTEIDFWGLIKIAFKDHLIMTLDHPVIQRLRGLT